MPLARPFGRALVVVALANLLFLALVYLAQGDRCAVLSRVQSAFETGELTTRDFLYLDHRRGWFQFDDCNALQMLINEDSPRLRRALAPRVFQENEDWEGQCRVLRYLASEWVDPRQLLSIRYSRYWHGYNVIVAFALRHMELRDLRRLLTSGVWLSIGLLALAAWRSGPRVRRTGLIIAAVASTVWAVPYFAPGLTQGPGDALLFLALAAIAARPKMAADAGRIVPYAAGFGALVVFLEMLTGKLPTAIALLAAITLAAARDENGPVVGGWPARGLALLAVTGFVLGAAATVVAKLLLAGTLVEPQASANFVARLSEYIGMPYYYSRWLGPLERHLPAILYPFARMARQSHMLTYGHSRAGFGLVAATGLAWLAAAVRGWRARHSEHGRDVLFLVGAAMVPAVWVLLLPLHAYIHAPFMVRMLIVPATLGPLALCWPRAREEVPPGAR
ncbi:MAG: hypothetical protein ACM3SU_06750 [Acidobacteriota bacterium]